MEFSPPLCLDWRRLALSWTISQYKASIGLSRPRVMPLPNLWALYNLRSSPFFQATLRADSGVTPLRLFVERQ